MLEHASIIGFVPVSDLDAAEAFYTGRLGLRTVERDGFALVLAASGGVKIRCVRIPGFKPQPFTVLGWEVADIYLAAKNLVTAGVEPLRYPHFQQDGAAVWTAPGAVAKVLWFNDPDGNVLSLSQHTGSSPDAGTA